MPKITIELDLPELGTAVELDPRMSVLLLVDPQNESVHPEGFRYHGPQGRAAVEAMATLLDRARAEGVTVIWLKSVRTPDQPIFSVFGHQPYRIDGTWSVEFAAPLDPLAGEPVVKKRTHNCFINTDMEGCLLRNGIIGPVWTFIVVGGSLTTCVLEAVKGLSMRDYRVVMPMDCIVPAVDLEHRTPRGDRAAMALAMLNQGTYPYTVTPLTSQEAIQFTPAPPLPPSEQGKAGLGLTTQGRM